MERVPFSLAISDDKLLGRAWKRLSLPQQVILKSFYGLPLDEQELRIWSAQQGPQWTAGDGVYDDLGYLVGDPKPVAYIPKEYNILTGNIGRRAGKSTELTAFIGAYEIGLGGHAKYASGLEMKFIYVAQDMSLAQTNMQGIVRTMRSSPMLSTILPANIGLEQVKFTNGITLEAMSNTIKSARGYAIMGAVLDELGFWYKDAKSANPDKEVEIAIGYAMQQFEHAKQIRITTPWTKEGLAYEAFVAGTEGRHLTSEEAADPKDTMEGHLVVYAPTAAMSVPEPLVTRRKLARKKKQDPIAFARESLALFIDAQAGYLSHARIADAVDKVKSLQLAPNIDIHYVAVMDPAFRNDGYTLSVLHKDKKHGIVQDYIFGWHPEPGERLNPSEILDAVKVVLDTYNLSVVYSDQHQLEALQQLALDRDFTIFGFDLTKMTKPKIMQTLNTKLNQGQLVLQDHKVQTQQLKDLQRTNLEGGGQRIAAPPGKEDDYATVLALGVYFADQLPDSETKEAGYNPANSREKSVIMREEAQRIYDEMYASGDPAQLSILDRSEYLRLLVEASDEAS